MLWQRLFGYGPVWIKITSTTQILSSSAPSQRPTARRPDQEGLHTFGDDLSCKPFITPFRRPCQCHSHMSHVTKQLRGEHRHTCSHMRTHTNLFAARILFGRDVFTLLFFLTANGHITLLRGKKHLRHSTQTNDDSTHWLVKKFIMNSAVYMMNICDRFVIFLLKWAESRYCWG